MIYEWRNGYPGSRGVDAQVAGEICETIRKRCGGKLMPRDVVEEAANDKSPIHPVFEWDDEKAAEEFRLEQARSMLRSIFVKISEADELINQYVNVRFADDDRCYVGIQQAVQDPEMRKQLLDQALREIVAWRKRHRQLKELSAVFDAVDRQLQDAA